MAISVNLWQMPARRPDISYITPISRVAEKFAIWTISRHLSFYNPCFEKSLALGALARLFYRLHFCIPQIVFMSYFIQTIPEAPK